MSLIRHRGFLFYFILSRRKKAAKAIEEEGVTVEKKKKKEGNRQTRMGLKSDIITLPDDGAVK